MKQNKPQHYFNPSGQYVIRRGKFNLLIYAILSILLGWGLADVIIPFLTNDITSNTAIPYIIILAILLAISIALLRMEIKERNSTITIDSNGITVDTEERIKWNNIQRCFYSTGFGKNPDHWLNIELKGGNIRKQVRLNAYTFNERKLIDAIVFYSKRELFYRTEQDEKEELKFLLKVLYILLIIIPLMCLLMYLLT